ncbi:MAG: hypothetical protein II449_00550 [Prevotella sp.]|nr:hypothetical protein [Prevotella sp.]
MTVGTKVLTAGYMNPKVFTVGECFAEITEPMNHCAMETVKKMLKGIWEFSRLASSNERQERAL